MQPQQPYYSPPTPQAPQNTGQYDFIVNNSASSGGPNKKTLLVFGLAAALLVIVLAWIILALAFGGSGGATAPLVTIAQEQAEIVRISKAAAQSNHVSGQDARNFTRSTQLTISSDRAQLVSFLAKNGKKLNDKQLGAKRSASTDSALDAAASSGTYNNTLISILQTQLKTYQNTVQQTYQSATSSSEKTLLKSEFDNATLLLEQSNQRN